MKIIEFFLEDLQVRLFRIEDKVSPLYNFPNGYKLGRNS